MSSIIKIKRSDTQGSIPSGLQTGEIAVNLFDRKLYVGNTSGGVSAIGGEDFRLSTQNSDEGAYIKLIGENVLSTNTVLIKAGTDIDVARQSNGSITVALEQTISSNTTGNAATASRLGTARNIALSGDVTGSTSFDGSGNVTLTATIADDSHNHVISNVDGLQTELDGKVDWSSLTSTNTAIRALVSDRMQVANTIALANARLGATASVTLTGDVTGTASFSSNAVSITTDLSDDVSTSRLVVNNYIQLSSTTDAPTHAEGRIFYDNTNKALAVYNDESDVTLQVGQEEWIRVYNNTGSTIGDGKAVYLSGISGDTPTIALADASNADKIDVVGLATHAIETSSYGYVTTRGVVSSIDTSGLTGGERAHLSPTSPGDLVATAPDYPNYPVDIGFVLDSDSEGNIYVDVQLHTEETSRVTGNARVDGDFTVGGDLTVLGNESITNFSNLEVSDSFVYLNGGDTVANTTFTGSGLDDMTFKGHYEGSGSVTFYVKIDNTGTPDTFSWSLDNFATTEGTNISITGGQQTLQDGISVEFEATTGHTLNDVWSGVAAPINTDTGWASNRNAGTYTHLGIFWDSSSNRFEAFKSYGPDVSGTINTSHATYAKGDFSANTFYGNLTGDVTGDVTGTAATADALSTVRYLKLNGDATGQATFDGSANATITVAIQDDSHNHVISNVDGLQSALDAKASISQLQSTNTAIRTLVDDRMQVANTVALVNDRMQVANTVLLVNDRLQVANATILLADKMSVANTQTLVDARLGATATVGMNGFVTGTANFSSNSVLVSTSLTGTVPLGTSTTGDYVNSITGTANEITVTGSGAETANVVIGLPDDVTIAGQLDVSENAVVAGNTSIGGTLSVAGDTTIDGNLTVEGALTYLSTSTVYADDSMFKLAANNSGDTVDSGIYAKYVVSGNSAIQYAGYFRDASDGTFKFYTGLDVEPTGTVDVTDSGYGLAQVDAIIDGGTY